METTAVATATSLAGFGLGGASLIEVGSLVSTTVAVLVAALALYGESRSRRKDELARIVSYFDDSGFFIRMWRMDQVTRTDGAASIGAVPVQRLMSRDEPELRALIRGALANDWSAERADMYGVYFFALRLKSWCTGWFGHMRRRRIRELNDAFGHQLFATLLNHQVVACRIRNDSVNAAYYPTHYGVLDPFYSQLVRKLADDLLTKGQLSESVARPMREKWDSLQAYLVDLKPLPEQAEPPVPAEATLDAHA